MYYFRVWLCSRSSGVDLSDAEALHRNEGNSNRAQDHCLDHLKERIARKVPTISQARSTQTIFPISQLCATSCEANEVGRKTERIPYVNHFRGKSAANCFIQLGKLEKTKKTPLINCRTITKGETTAGAPRPLLIAPAKAIPRTVEQAEPRTTNQVKRSQRAALCGRCRWKNSAPKSNSIKT